MEFQLLVTPKSSFIAAHIICITTFIGPKTGLFLEAKELEVR